jgi:hypothetical protein
MEREYVIDLAMPKETFDAACKAYGELFGLESVHTGAVHDLTGQVDMRHFPVGGLNAFGVMTVLRRPEEVEAGEEVRPGTERLVKFIDRHPEGGIYLLGHLVDDVEGYLSRLRAEGIPVESTEPQPYPDGHLIVTQFVHGTAWEFAQHKGAEVTGDWNGLREGASGAGIERAYRVDVAVRDLDAAIESVRKLTGREPGPRRALDDDGALRGVDFPIGGLEALGLVTLAGAPKGGLSQTVEDQLDRYGEGAAMVGFHVPDLRGTHARVEKVGGKLRYSEDQPSKEGLTNVTEPIYGVVYQFTEPTGRKG